MAFYEYYCNNEDCPNLLVGRDHYKVEMMRPMSDRNNYPNCDHCGSVMTRQFSAPSVSWKYLSANGEWKTSSLGPAQKADRRLVKYHNGQPIWSPIYKGTSKKE